MLMDKSFLLWHNSFSLTFSFLDLCLSFNIQMWLLPGYTKKVEAGDFFLFYNVEVYVIYYVISFHVKQKYVMQRKRSVSLDWS